MPTFFKDFGCYVSCSQRHGGQDSTDVEYQEDKMSLRFIHLSFLRKQHESNSFHLKKQCLSPFCAGQIDLGGITTVLLYCCLWVHDGRYDLLSHSQTIPYYQARSMKPLGHFAIRSYGSARSKNFRYHLIPEFWWNFASQCKDMEVVSEQYQHCKTTRKFLSIPNLSIPRISNKNINRNPRIFFKKYIPFLKFRANTTQDRNAPQA